MNIAELCELFVYAIVASLISATMLYVILWITFKCAEGFQKSSSYETTWTQTVPSTPAYTPPEPSGWDDKYHEFDKKEYKSIF